MSTDPRFSAELLMLCGRLRDRDITEAESKRLNEMLLASRDARRFYRTYMALASALESRATRQDSVDAGAEADENIEVLVDLLRLEQDAEVIPFVEQPLPMMIEQEQSPKQSLSVRELRGVAGYLLAHAAKSSKVRWGAAAAVVLLGLTVYLVLSWGNGSTPPVQEFVNEPPKVQQLPVVATLTAEHQAQWRVASGVRQPGVGDGLHPGQQLVLAEGYAEITTKRGAVATLEAPCTIEVIDEDNALRLHTGKLAGRVSPDARGFTVYTSGSRVVDIGTKFGVAVGPVGDVNVRVFAGRIDVAIGQEEFGTPMLKGDIAKVRGGRLEPATYNAEFDFLQDLSGLRLVPEITGKIQLLSSPPPSIRTEQFEHPDSAFLFLEKRAVVVPAQTEVNDGPSDLVERKEEMLALTTREMLADVYTLHYDPDLSDTGFAKGTIKFNSRIIGVIYKPVQLGQTDEAFGTAETAYEPATTRGIEAGDEITIDKDGQTLIFDLSAAKSDQVRILVESTNPQASLSR